MGSSSMIFENLQKEFCPPLDSALVAAILSDFDYGDVSEEQINNIRSTLKDLAADAEQEEQSSESNIPPVTEDTCSLSAFDQGDYATPATSNSSSESDRQSISSPLSFLQAALPHISTDHLQKALGSANNASSFQDGRDNEFDMWELVAGILTEESIREMEERGLDGLDEEGYVGLGISFDEEDSWERVGNKKTKYKSHVVKKAAPRSKPKKTTITDIRQQQHIRPRSHSVDGSSKPATTPDPWTQISSVSTHLATLLPPHAPSFFQPYFHSPNHATPYAAVVAALTAIANAQTQPPKVGQATQNHASSSSSAKISELDQEHVHDHTLVSMLEIILPNVQHLDSEARSRLISDADLSLSATQGRPEDALDLVQLLQDLAEDHDGYLEMGVYHTQPPTPVTETPNVWGQSLVASPTSSIIRHTPASTKLTFSTLPDGPPPVPQPPPPKNGKNGRDAHVNSKNKPSPYQWQMVPKRKPPNRQTSHPLAAHIPAYERDVNGMKTAKARMKVAGSGNGIGKGGKGDVGELLKGGGGGGGEKDYRHRVADSLRRRDEMLREASKMWQRGGRKNRGGEVALYFAERAREFQEMAKRDSLEAARVMVESKRIASKELDTIDLHGTTVAEGVQISKETLVAMSCSPSKPLKIITGRGTHSVGHVSILKPALRKALVEDGWSITSWDGGLVVRGKKT